MSRPETLPPLVSVCTITYNRRPLLPLLMDCLLAQDYPLARLQWVLVDDSDIGEPPDLEPARRAGITVLWRQLHERMPIGAKRNLAHALASGEWIVVMDDDDYYPPSRISHAVERLRSSGADLAGCDRLPLLLLPEASRWLTPPYSTRIATANSLAYHRRVLEAGHRFEPTAETAEEPAFLAGPTGQLHPLLQLDPFRSLVCISHGGNTVDKRTWMAVQAGQGFEALPEEHRGFPDATWLARYRRALGLPAATPRGPDHTPKRHTDHDADHDADHGADHGADHNTEGCCEAIAPASSPLRIAVITPYHNEALETIRRCHDSVQAQTLACVHVLVADGPRRPEVEALPGRHLCLGVGHGDNGNTPRSLGALAAMNEGCDGIAFLDADNWFRPDHLEQAIATRAQGNFEVVFSDRQIVFPDGQRLLTPGQEDLDHSHVDTSCMVIFPPAFASLALWAQMPAAYGPICDRVVFRELMARYRCGWTGCATLYFETWYWNHFLAAGLIPPLTAKFVPCRPEAEWTAAAAAFRQRSATPIYPGPLGVAPSKPRLRLVSLLAEPQGGGDRLQWHLCRHFSFSGIPENDLLWHWRRRFGADHRQRREASTIVQELAAQLPLPGLATMLRPDRSYTALEAYFRVVLACTTPEALAFCRRYGALTVLDRSSTLPLVADLLWAGLPLHQAVLLLPDPDRWLAAADAMLPGDALPGDAPQRGEDRLLDRWQQRLQPLRLPLQAAAPGQLLLVREQELRRHPEAVVAQVCAFLGLAANPVGATEPLPDLDRIPLHNNYFQELQARTEELALPLGLGPTWTAAAPHDALHRDPRAPRAPRPTAQDHSDDRQRRWLQTLLAPLRPWLEGNGTSQQRQQEACSSTPAELGPLAPLQTPVGELVDLLRQHQAWDA
ncbi:MAG: glycosyltransferase [Cyanobium sp.]